MQEFLCKYCGESFKDLAPRSRSRIPKTCGRCSSKSPTERFWARVKKQEDGCWIWLGSKSDKGYGGFPYEDSHNARAHVVAYKLNKGPIGQGLQVLHTCDNPSCVNPDHLYTGTHQGNMDDMVRRHRSCTGEKNGGGGKLTLEEVTSIKHDVRSGPEIAREYNISRTLVSLIKCGKNWKEA